MAKSVQEAPDPDTATLPPDQPAGTSADASQKGTLSKMWDNWTAHPSNNAALINFGLQMMQPIGAGQSRMGHFAQALGAGAEASQRNVAAEQERQALEEKQALAEREETRKEQETGLYGKYVEGMNANRQMRKLGKNEIAVLAQRGAQTWLNKGDVLGDETGLLDRIKMKYPDIKGTGPKGKVSKADVMADPRGRAEVLSAYTPQGDQYTGGILGSGTTMGDIGAAQSNVGTPAEAVAWARANPGDPRAQQILQRYGGQ